MVKTTQPGSLGELEKISKREERYFQRTAPLIENEVKVLSSFYDNIRIPLLPCYMLTLFGPVGTLDAFFSGIPLRALDPTLRNFGEFS